MWLSDIKTLEGMRENIKISIIIPCWNSENTIARCLESIVANQSDNIEIICIDDCSTDNTVDIIDSFIQRDRRIHVSKKHEHTNAGDARNHGIAKASGLYYWFIDSDDFIAPESIEICLNKIKKYFYPDLIIFPYKKITGQGYERHTIHSQADTNEVVEIKNLHLENYYQLTSPEVWNKLFKSELIHENRIHFQSIKSSNDIFLTRAYMSTTKNYLFIDELLYFHDRTIANSIGTYRGLYLNTIHANQELKEYLIRNNIYKEFKKTFLKSYKSNLKHELKNTRKATYKALYTLIIFLIDINLRICSLSR